MVPVKHSHCLLCGREYPAGLNIMGCFLCFPCEKQLLQTGAVRLPRQRRNRLLALYGDRGS
jgi:hypothetical protein